MKVGKNEKYPDVKKRDIYWAEIKVHYILEKLQK